LKQTTIFKSAVQYPGLQSSKKEENQKKAQFPPNLCLWMEPTFYKIWHEIFGAANRILVEKGMFYDPYGGSRKHEGYLPVVWHMGVAGDLR